MYILSPAALGLLYSYNEKAPAPFLQSCKTGAGESQYFNLQNQGDGKGNRGTLNAIFIV